MYTQYKWQLNVNDNREVPTTNFNIQLFLQGALAGVIDPFVQRGPMMVFIDIDQAFDSFGIVRAREETTCTRRVGVRKATHIGRVTVTEHLHVGHD